MYVWLFILESINLSVHPKTLQTHYSLLRKTPDSLSCLKTNGFQLEYTNHLLQIKFIRGESDMILFN